MEKGTKSGRENREKYKVINLNLIKFKFKSLTTLYLLIVLIKSCVSNT